MKRIILALWAMFAGLPAFAASDLKIDASAWTAKENRPPRPRTVGISVPRQAASLTLYELGRMSSNLDNVAKYQSADHAVFGTIYIYRPLLPDAVLSTIATTSFVGLAYPGAVRGPDALVSAGGHVQVAHRSYFDNAMLPPDRVTYTGASATTAAFLQAGGWIVKIRVTGPQARRDEVFAALDGLLNGLQFGKDAAPKPAVAYDLSDCPDVPDATATAALPEMADAMLSIQTGTQIMSGGLAENFKPGGARKICIMNRAAAGINGSVVLRPTDGPAEPRWMLMGDAGRILSVQPPPPALDGAGKAGGNSLPSRRTIIISSIGQAIALGPFTKAPTLDQLLGLITGDAGWLGEPFVAVGSDREGNFKMNILLKEPQLR